MTHDTEKNIKAPRELFTRVLMEDPDTPGELILDLGQEICDAMGWQEGDTLTWQDLGDGSWSLKRQDTGGV